MFQKLPAKNIEWIGDTSQFNEDVKKNCHEESDKGHFLKFDVQNTEKLHELHNDLFSLPERAKIGKIEKVATNLHDKTEYVIHIKKFKASIKSRVSSQISYVHRVIKFNQNAWLKPHIDMN